MTIASGIRARVIYVAEVTHGTTPTTPVMKVLRCNSRAIEALGEMLESEEARSDRETTDVRTGFRSVGGNIAFELSLAAHDDVIEAALGGTWAAGTSVASISAVASTSKFNRASGSFITDGYRPGQWVTVAGFTAPGDNGLFLVTAVSATDLTVVGTLTDEAAGGGKTVIQTGKLLNSGSTLTTFTFERQFLDVALYQPFRGVAVNTMSLSLKPKQIAQGSIGLVGMSYAAESGTSLDAAPDAAPTYSPMNAFGGAMYEGGSAISVITGIELAVDNKRTVEAVVGSANSPDVFDGHIMVSGTITMLFQNSTHVNKFVNGTETSVWFKMVDPDDSTQFISVCLPRVLYSGEKRDPQRQGPVVLTLPFRAFRHTTYGTSIWFQRSNS